MRLRFCSPKFVSILLVTATRSSCGKPPPLLRIMIFFPPAAPSSLRLLSIQPFSFCRRRLGHTFEKALVHCKPSFAYQLARRLTAYSERSSCPGRYHCSVADHSIIVFGGSGVHLYRTRRRGLRRASWLSRHHSWMATARLTLTSSVSLG